MDKKAAIRNISISIIMQILVLISSIVSRQQLINILGIEANGIFALFLSIFGFIALVEVGFAAAITFNLYKPIYNKDYVTASSLYFLCRKIFFKIGIAMFIIGLALTPIIPLLVDDSSNYPQLMIYFFIFLVGSILPFFVICKTAFIDAHKHNHISNLIRSSIIILQFLLQAIVLLYTQSFLMFFLIIPIVNLLFLVIITLVFTKKYSFNLTEKTDLDILIKKDVKDKTRAQLYHKIGLLGTNTINNILIAIIINVITLGYFSNYIMIFVAVSNIFSSLFNSIVPIIGHARQKLSSKNFETLFNKIYTINIIVGIIIFFGYLAIIDDIIALLFGLDLVMTRDIGILISIHAFIQFSRRGMLLFRDATGTFYQDRFKPIIECFLGISLSLLFLNLFGVIGVVLSTIIVDLFVNQIIEPYVVYKYQFDDKPNKYYFKNYLIMIAFAIVAFTFDFIPLINHNRNIIALINNGFISIIVSLLFIGVIYLFNVTFRKSLNELIFISFNLTKKIFKK